MCNLASEGGRCHAHISEQISKLKLKDENNLLEEASKAGVPVDPELVELNMIDYDVSVVEEEKKVAALKDHMLAVHAEAMEAKEEYNTSSLSGKEILNRTINGTVLDSAWENFANKIGKGPDTARNAYELAEFGDYPDKQNLVESYQYMVAAKNETDEAYAKMRAAREKHDEDNKAAVLKNNIELRAARRRLNIASVKESLGNYSYNTLRVEESEYRYKVDQAISEAGLVEGGKLPMEEHHARIAKISANSQEAYDAYQNNLRSYTAYIDKKEPGYASHKTNQLDRGLMESRQHDTADYEKSKVIHKVKKFNEAKEAYVKAAKVMDPETKAKNRATEEAHLRKYGFDQNALAAYRNTGYKETASAKAIKEELDAEKRELVLTPTYRRKVRDEITKMERTGRAVEAFEARKKLQRLDAAAEKRKSRNANASV